MFRHLLKFINIESIMSIILPRNSIIPITKHRLYSIDKDNQTEVSIKIYEGERKLTKDNFFVGEFILSGFEPAPRGFTQINVSIHVDINGIITVTAEESETQGHTSAACLHQNLLQLKWFSKSNLEIGMGKELNSYLIFSVLLPLE